MLLHGGVKLLGQIIGYIRHPRLLLIGSAHTAFVFIGLLIVLLLAIFAVTWRTLGGGVYTTTTCYHTVTKLIIQTLNRSSYNSLH